MREGAPAETAWTCGSGEEGRTPGRETPETALSPGKGAPQHLRCRRRPPRRSASCRRGPRRPRPERPPGRPGFYSLDRSRKRRRRSRSLRRRGRRRSRMPRTCSTTAKPSCRPEMANMSRTRSTKAATRILRSKGLEKGRGGGDGENRDGGRETLQQACSELMLPSHTEHMKCVRIIRHAEDSR